MAEFVCSAFVQPKMRMWHGQGPRARDSLRGAFTLIEVLVVVAIIALLVAILLPSLSRARKQAQSATCLSNLKQFGVGFQFYALDNRTQPPPNRTFGGTPPEYKDSDWWYYRHMVPRYIAAEKLSLTRSALFGVFVCPGDRKSASRSYSMNVFANNYPRRDQNGSTIHPDAVLTSGGRHFNPFTVASPARYMLLADAHPIYDAAPVAPGYLATRFIIGDGGETPYEKFRRWPQPNDSTLLGYVDFTKHLDRANYLLADGHSEGLPRNQAIDETARRSKLRVLWSPSDNQLNK